jgi:gamma-glutamylcyclotransferase (GGCT)/AIG2-like uncharacterized protein YtfP
MSEYLFLYGTLLTGTPVRQINKLVSQCLQCVGSAIIYGQLYDIGTFPGAVLSGQQREKVFGKVYIIRDPGKCLKVLDQYEVYDPGCIACSEFVRERVTAYLIPKQQSIQAWFYRYNQPVKFRPRIIHGDWTRYFKR